MRKRRSVLLPLLLLMVVLLGGCVQIDSQLDLGDVNKPVFAVRVLVNNEVIRQAEQEWKKALTDIKAKCKETIGCTFSQIKGKDQEGFQMTQAVKIEEGKGGNEIISILRESQKEGNTTKERYEIDYHLGGYSGTNSAELNTLLLGSKGSFTVKLPDGARDVETNGEYSQKDGKITWQIDTVNENTLSLTFTHTPGISRVWMILASLAVILGGLLIWFLVRSNAQKRDGKTI